VVRVEEIKSDDSKKIAHYYGNRVAGRENTYYQEFPVAENSHSDFSNILCEADNIILEEHLQIINK